MDEPASAKTPFWKKIPGYRTGTKWKMAVASIVYFFIFCGVMGAIFGEETPDQATQPVVSQKETTKDWSTADITEDTVKKALAGENDIKPTFTDKNFPEDITEISIIDTGNGKKNVWIYYKPESAWDETHLVKMAGSTAIFACSILYQNVQIGDVAFFTQGDFTDQYGKSKTDVAVKLVISNDLAGKADWKGLATRHESDPGNIYRISDNYKIHLGIKKNIKANEIKL